MKISWMLSLLGTVLFAAVCVGQDTASTGDNPVESTESQPLVKQEIPKPVYGEISQDNVRRIEAKITELYEKTDMAELDAVVEALANMGADTIGVMEPHMANSPWRVRYGIAQTIAKLAGQNAAARELGFYTLVRLLSDNNWEVRLAALDGVANCENSLATPYVADLLLDPIWRVRQRAVKALGNLNDIRIAPRLLEMFKLETEPELRDRIVESLGALKYEPAKPLFYELLSGQTPSLKLRAFKILAEMEGGLVNDQMRQGMANLIVDLKNPETTVEQKDEIVEIAASAKRDCIAYVVESLQTCPDIKDFQRHTGILEKVRESIPAEDPILTESVKVLILKETDDAKLRALFDVIAGRPAGEIAGLLREALANVTDRGKINLSTRALRFIKDAKVEGETSEELLETVLKQKDAPKEVLQAALDSAVSQPVRRYWQPVLQIYEASNEENILTRANTFMSKLLDAEKDNALVLELVQAYDGLKNNTRKQGEIFTLVTKNLNQDDPNADRQYREFYSTVLRSSTDPKTKELAVEGLAKIGNKAGDLKFFQEIVTDVREATGVRVKAIEVLTHHEKYKDAYFDASTRGILLNIYAPEDPTDEVVESAAVKALDERFGSKELYQHFAETLGKNTISPRVRAALTASLKKNARGDTLEKVFSYLDRKDEVLRSSLEVLQEVAKEGVFSKTHFDRVRAFYATATTDEFKNMSLEILFNKPELESADVFLDVLDRNKDNVVQMRRAIQALGAIGHAEALPALHALLKDDSQSRVHREIIEAMGVIGEDQSIPLLLDLLKTGTYRDDALKALVNYKSGDIEKKLVDCIYGLVGDGLTPAQRNSDRLPFLVSDYIRTKMNTELGNTAKLEEEQLLEVLATDPADSETDAVANKRLADLAEKNGDVGGYADYLIKAWEIGKKNGMSAIDEVAMAKVLWKGYTARARQQIGQKKIKDAVKTLEHLLTLDDSASSLNSAAWCLIENGVEIEKAVEWALASVDKEADPLKKVIKMDTLGWGYYRLGKLAEAEATFRDALKIRDMTVVKYHLCEVLAAAGAHAESIKLLEIVSSEADKYNAEIVANEALKALADSPESKDRYLALIERIKQDQKSGQ